MSNKKTATTKKSRKTIDNLNFPTGTLLVEKKTRTVLQTKTEAGWNDDLSDKDIYAANRKTCSFMSPKNVNGIAKQMKKYATKFPDYVAILSGLGIAEAITATSEAVNHIASAPIQVILDNPKKKSTKKSTATDTPRLKKDGTVDKRYLAKS